jgi:hypothetical protein
MNNLSFIYQQTTSTVQDILSKQQTVFIVNPVTGAQSTPYILNLPNLVNDVYIIKHAALSETYTTGKSSFSFSLFNERRTDQVTQELDTIYGIGGGWTWLMEPRLSLFVTPSWQIENSTVKTSDNNLYKVTVGVTRGIPMYFGRRILLNATMQGEHVQELSGTVGNSYIENRATVGFNVQF